jgi:hypothetical protein
VLAVRPREGLQRAECDLGEVLAAEDGRDEAVRAHDHLPDTHRLVVVPPLRARRHRAVDRSRLVDDLDRHVVGAYAVEAREQPRLPWARQPEEAAAFVEKEPVVSRGAEVAGGLFVEEAGRREQ